MRENIRGGGALNANRRNAWCSSMDGGFVSSLVGGVLAAIVAVLIMLFCVVMQIWGCLTGGGGPRVTKDGPGTALSNSTPAAVLDSIREEFRALKKPVLENFKHYRAYRTYPFGGVSCEMPEYWQPRVTIEARTFLSHHANSELVVALLPMVDDPDFGGEAAAVLGAMPVTSSSWSCHAEITSLIHSSRYRSPADRGAWNPQVAEAVKQAVATYFPCADMRSRQERQPTLSEVILRLLRDNRSLRQRTVAEAVAFADTHHDAVSLSVYYYSGAYLTEPPLCPSTVWWH